MSPGKMAESIEAQDRCNNWQEETRRETMRSGMKYTLFNRTCQLNQEETKVLGYEGNYETGNSRQDKEIRELCKVVKTFQLSKS